MVEPMSSPPPAGRFPVIQRLIEISSITLFFGLTPLVIIRLADDALSYQVAHPGWVIALGFMGGLFFADFISGFVHWAADNFGDEAWPVLGTGFIRPFREHHVHPTAMTHHRFVELNGANCAISVPTFLVGYWSGNPQWPSYGLFVGVFWLSVAYWVLGTNQFHAWAHTAEPPKIARWLQRYHLILTPEHHAQHHQPPHNRNYCITMGWMDAPLRVLRFFPIMEWLAAKVLRLEPRHKAIAASLSTGLAPEVESASRA